jgi:hypothetical protein
MALVAVDGRRCREVTFSGGVWAISSGNGFDAQNRSVESMSVDQNVYGLRSENRVTVFCDAGYHRDMRTELHQFSHQTEAPVVEDSVIARLHFGLTEHDKVIARLERLVEGANGEKRVVFEGMLSLGRNQRDVMQTLLDGLLIISARFQAT